MLLTIFFNVCQSRQNRSSALVAACSHGRRAKLHLLYRDDTCLLTYLRSLYLAFSKIKTIPHERFKGFSSVTPHYNNSNPTLLNHGVNLV